MITVPVSVGEVLDKISILQIKSERITNPDKLSNVVRELTYLAEAVKYRRYSELETELKQVNEALWDVEDKLRIAEKRQDFGDNFIALARSVYVLNDQRAEIKRQINLIAGSELVEEKSYA
jgi:peptide methionine sulfoxide reductase MsrA